MLAIPLHLTLTGGWNAIKASMSDVNSPFVAVEVQRALTVQRLILDVGKRILFGPEPELHTAQTVAALLDVIGPEIRSNRLRRLAD